MTTSTAVDETPVLEVEDLSVTYWRGGAERRAVKGVSFRLMRGEVLGLVGESGSGKSSVALSLLGLLPKGSVCGGAARIGSTDLLDRSAKQRRAVLGSQIGFVPQSPSAALTPVLSIGYQMCEAVRAHRRCSKSAAEQHALRTLARVGISDGERILRQYPHQISGGTAQRVLISIALLHDPQLVVADEPTSALDATVQRQILDLLSGQVRDLDIAMLIISHDFGVVAALADRVAVLYAGRVVETGDADSILSAPSHPYTAALLDAARAKPSAGGERRGQVYTSEVCDYAHCCPSVDDDCLTGVPELAPIPGGRRARCLHPLRQLAEERR